MAISDKFPARMASAVIERLNSAVSEASTAATANGLIEQCLAVKKKSKDVVRAGLPTAITSISVPFWVTSVPLLPVTAPVTLVGTVNAMIGIVVLA